MLIRKSHILYLWLAVAAVTLAVCCGCEERDVPLLIDEEEIIRYLSVTEEGRELFRTADLIPDDPYMLPCDSAVYRDFVDSTWREFDVAIDSTRTYNFGALGDHYAATTRVTDLFFVTTIKVLETEVPPETTWIFSEREVNRYGYFIKLGEDDKPYLGWKLWGFNSLGESDPPVNLSVTTADGAHTLAAMLARYSYQGPGFVLSFIRLSDINNLENGDTLIFNVSPRGGYEPVYYHLTTGATDAGFVTQAMDSVNVGYWVDTIVTPSPNPRLWNVVFIQSFMKPPSFQYVRGWCIPYRIPQ